jgi:hypothetical protein
MPSGMNRGRAIWRSAMPGQVASGDFASGSHAESTESTESFQPHVLGEEQIPSISVAVIHQFQSPSGKKLSAHSVHSAVPLDAQSGTCCASRTALSEAQPSRCARQPEGSPEQGATPPSCHRATHLAVEGVGSAAVIDCPVIGHLLQMVGPECAETHRRRAEPPFVPSLARDYGDKTLMFNEPSRMRSH